MAASQLETAAHVIQFALTPVFLLSGIAALMNVFTTRMWRVSSANHGRVKLSRKHKRMIAYRTNTLIIAVGLAALAGAMTCGSALVLFVGALQGADVTRMLFMLFGGAMLLTMGALGGFFFEILLAGSMELEQLTHHPTARHTSEEAPINPSPETPLTPFP